VKIAVEEKRFDRGYFERYTHKPQKDHHFEGTGGHSNLFQVVKAAAAAS